MLNYTFLFTLQKTEKNEWDRLSVKKSDMQHLEMGKWRDLAVIANFQHKVHLPNGN